MSRVLATVSKVAAIAALIPSPIQPIAAAVAATTSVAAQLTAPKPVASGSSSGTFLDAEPFVQESDDMTLQNGLLATNASYIWSDTGMYSLQREFLFHQPKIAVSDDWPYAILHSGTSDVSQAVDVEIDTARPQTHGALIQCIQRGLKAHLNNPYWEGPQRTLVASFDGCARLTAVDTTSLGGYPPLQPVPIRTHLISSKSEAILKEIAGGVTAQTMPRVIGQQHAESALDDHWPIAGKIVRAKVTSAGVELAELADLPDPTRLAA